MKHYYLWKGNNTFLYTPYFNLALLIKMLTQFRMIENHPPSYYNSIKSIPNSTYFKVDVYEER